MKAIANALTILLLCLPLVAQAGSVSGTKINRIRTDSVGRTFVKVVTPPDPDTETCPSGFAGEDFYFFSNTVEGRVVFAQVLTAYTTQVLVDISGDGTCLVTGVSPFFSRWEQISNVTVR